MSERNYALYSCIIPIKEDTITRHKQINKPKKLNVAAQGKQHKKEIIKMADVRVFMFFTV